MVGNGSGGIEASTGDRYRVYGIALRVNAMIVAAVVHAGAFALALYGWQHSTGTSPSEERVIVTVLPLSQDKPKQRPLPGAPRREAQPKPPTAPPSRQPLARGSEMAPALAVAAPEYLPIDGGREDKLALTTQAYREAIMARLEAERRYPREQLRAGHDGKGALLFRIDRDGQLIEARVQTSTGRGALDRAALAIVHSAAPFPGIPPELPDELVVTLPVAFLLVSGEPEIEAVER